MNKLLIIAVLALAYLCAVEVLKCNYCRNLRPDNVCKHVEKYCQAGKRQFCYSRVTTRGGQIQRVQRGCTSRCLTQMYKNVRKKAEFMVCCEEDYCNNHKIWNKKY